jgi:hypothetical protein
MRVLVVMALVQSASGCNEGGSRRPTPSPVPPTESAPSSGAEPVLAEASLPPEPPPPFSPESPPQSSPEAASTACADAGSIGCPTYARYVNPRFAFSVDVPTFFVKKDADADGRAQNYEYRSKARIRAWAMYDSPPRPEDPPMTVEQLYGDWTRRDGVTFKTLAVNTWVVRGAEHGRLFYSRSILADGIIATIEIRYDPSLADDFEPIVARLGASLMTIPGEGARQKKGRDGGKGSERDAQGD